MSVGLLLTLGACLDYSPEGVVGPAPNPTLVATSADEFPPVEVCNGVDDDGDSDVDEGFPDTDDDGVPDCLDSECSVDNSRDVALDDPYSCITGGVTVTGEIALEEVWTYRWAGPGPKGCSGLVAADMEGDGRVELVCAGVYGSLVVFDGGTGAILRSFGDASGNEGVAAVDVDGDGIAELYTVGARDDRLLGYRSDSGALFMSSGDIYAANSLDGVGAIGAITRMAAFGGTPAMVGLKMAVSLQDGSTLASFPLDNGIGVEPVAADVDFDELPDILMAGYRFDQAGGVIFAPVKASKADARYARAIQADADPDGEALFTSKDGWEVAEPDGTRILVPRISGFDRLLRHHSSSGRSARGTRTLRLLAAPGILARRPRSASSTIMRCTDGGASPKNRAMSVSAGGWRLTFV